MRFLAMLEFICEKDYFVSSNVDWVEEVENGWLTPISINQISNKLRLDFSPLACLEQRCVGSRTKNWPVCTLQPNRTFCDFLWILFSCSRHVGCLLVTENMMLWMKNIFLVTHAFLASSYHPRISRLNWTMNRNVFKNWFALCTFHSFHALGINPVKCTGTHAFVTNRLEAWCTGDDRGTWACAHAFD